MARGLAPATCGGGGNAVRPPTSHSLGYATSPPRNRTAPSAGQPLGDLSRVIKSLSGGDCALFYQLAQLFAFEQFSDDIGRAFMRADVVNREDVRVVERRGGAGFLLEAAQTIRIRGELGRQYFDGDLPTESWIFSQIDLTHSTCAE